MKKRKTKNTKKSDDQDFDLLQAERYGIDIQALEDNLKLSYKERIIQHQIALDMFNKFYNKANQ